nr:IS6 family transposase [Vibrio sagamiensis]
MGISLYDGHGTITMSYTNLSDMLSKRGVFVNCTTIYRWFIHYAPILHKKLRRYQITLILWIFI